MKPTFQTNSNLVILSYLQKIIAVIVAVFFGVNYLRPVMQKATGLSVEYSIIFILVSLLVFELILHFGLESFVLGWHKKEVRILDLLGVVFTFLLIAFLGFFATDNLPYFRQDTAQKVSLINLDSLAKIHTEKQEKSLSDYAKKEKDLDSLYQPVMAKLRDSFWALSQVQATYNDSKTLLLRQKKAELDRLESARNLAISEAKKTNEARQNKLKREDSKDANSTAWLSVVVLAFSLYSTVVIANHSPKVRSTDISTDSTPEVRLPEIVVQQSTPIQNSITVVVQNQTEAVPKKYDKEKRILATNYIAENGLQSFEFLHDKFGISRTVYFEIKRELLCKK